MYKNVSYFLVFFMQNLFKVLTSTDQQQIFVSFLILFPLEFAKRHIYKNLNLIDSQKHNMEANPLVKQTTRGDVFSTSFPIEISSNRRFRTQT